MMSDGGSWYVAVSENVPLAGAPAVAVVKPLASTRPAVSVTCQTSAASNTLASPLIVSGLRTRVFASGSFTRIPPRAESSGVGTGVGVGVGLGVGLELEVAVGAVVLRTGVGVGVVTTIRLSAQAAENRTPASTSAAILTNVAPARPRPGRARPDRVRWSRRRAPTPPSPRRLGRRASPARTRQRQVRRRRAR